MQTRQITVATNGQQRKSKQGQFINHDVSISIATDSFCFFFIISCNINIPQEKEKENEEQGDFEEDGALLLRCEYELQRAENIKNLVILSDLGLVSCDYIVSL